MREELIGPFTLLGSVLQGTATTRDQDSFAPSCRTDSLNLRIDLFQADQPSRCFTRAFTSLTNSQETGQRRIGSREVKKSIRVLCGLRSFHCCDSRLVGSHSTKSPSRREGEIL
jgi:hypothetical protein